MDLDAIITSRHSIRDYKKKDVEYQVISKILDTAKHAPSSGNIQNWRFIIIKDKNKKEAISRLCLNQLWMNQAPVFIVICYDERNIKVMFPRDYKEFSLQNAAIISTLIMLKASELGLGTCWVPAPKPENLLGLLKVPDFITPCIILTLGYPEGMYKKTRREALENVCYFEEYGIKKRGVNLTPFPLSKHVSMIKDKIRSIRKK